MNQYLRIRELARKMRKHSTSAEECFWQKVRNRKLYGLKFNRQFIITFTFDATFTKFYIADFYCEQLKLIVELDGQIHLKQQEQDLIRTEHMYKRGFQVIRFSNDQVLKEWEYVKSVIKNILDSSRVS
jgi:very-short-patch-repair endonuclease